MNLRAHPIKRSFVTGELLEQMLGLRLVRDAELLFVYFDEAAQPDVWTLLPNDLPPAPFDTMTYHGERFIAPPEGAES